MPSLRVVASCLVLLHLACALSLVVAGFAPCSDPAVCGDGTNSCCQTVKVNGVANTYCCPGTGNSFDYNSLQCNNFAQCALPTYGTIAVWPTRGCLGTSTYQSFKIGGGVSSSDCLDVSASLAANPYSFAPVLQIGYFAPSAVSWTIYQYATAADCAGRSSKNYFTKAETIDPSCYNFKDGSFSLYVPGQVGAPAAGTTVSFPPMHATQYRTPPVTTSATDASLALWMNDDKCSSGTAFTSTVTQGNCYNTAGTPGANNLYSYKLTCAAKTVDATWTLTPYTLTGCQAQYANPTIGGVGPTCVRIGLWAGSAFIDCATQASGRNFNYLPPTNGSWSGFGACSAACGGGISSRSCSAPAPSGGGAACVGSPEQQACNTDACATPAGGSVSSSSSSAGSGTVPTPTGSGSASTASAASVDSTGGAGPAGANASSAASVIGGSASFAAGLLALHVVAAALDLVRA